MFVPAWVATTCTVNAALAEYFFQRLQPFAKVSRRFRNLLDSLSYRVILVFGNNPLSGLAVGHVVLLLYLAAQISRHCSTRGFKCQMAVQAQQIIPATARNLFLSGPQEVSRREQDAHTFDRNFAT